MSGSGIIEAEVFRTEQVSRLARTSDPSSPSKGDAWIRTDVQPTSDSVAALRIQGDSGYLEAPLFDPSASTGSDVYVGQRFLFDDGTEGHLLVTESGGVGSPRVVTSGGTEYQAHDSLSAIPDTQINRETDNNSASNISARHGLEITTSEDIDGIKAEISANTSGLTTAYLAQSDGTVLASTDVSGLSSGETFEIAETVNANTTVELVGDAGGSDYTIGFYETASYPYEGAAFDLTNGIFSNSDTNPDRAYVFNNVRNLNF
jgi:hypothetical protein